MRGQVVPSDLNRGLAFAPVAVSLFRCQRRSGHQRTTGVKPAARPVACTSALGGTSRRAAGVPDRPSDRGAPIERRKRLSVVVADAYPLFRDALERAVRSWPEFELAGSAGREHLFDIIDEASPDVLVIDHLTLGIDVGGLLAQFAGVRVLLISNDPGPTDVYAAIEMGAAGYLGKDCSPRELCDAIAIVGRGEAFIGAGVQEGLASEIRLRGTGSGEFLTAREREVLTLIADGLSAPEIARHLKIGTATVKTHQHHIYERLGVRERAAAVAQAMRRGLIE
jgi:two-component system, NarL family, nitrate/nitrite response regulator NarL